MREINGILIYGKKAIDPTDKEQMLSLCNYINESDDLYPTDWVRGVMSILVTLYLKEHGDGN